MFRLIIGLIAFTFSMLGYGIFLRKREVIPDFIPVLTFSMIIIIMFIGGLLNILKLSVIVIIFVGLYLFMLYSWKSKSMWLMIKNLYSPGVVFFIIFSLVFFIVTRKMLFLHYDNFSHWALIVKSMSLNNSLPNFETNVIHFTSYPPGSALFIYFLIKLVGVTEANAIFAQILLVLASITSIFSWNNVFSFDFSKNENKNVRYLGLCFLFVFSFYLFRGPTSLMDLLVDNLLLLMAIATMNIIFYYFNNLKKGLLLSSPLIICMLLVKNSGVIFVGLSSVFLMISFYHYICSSKGSFSPKNIVQFLSVLTLPWMSFFLWLRHVKYVYPAGTSGKHEMSLSYYKKIFSEKTPADILEISKRFVFRMFDLQSFSFFYELLIFVLIAMGLIVYWSKKEQLNIRTLKLQVMSSIVLFLGYMAILWAMYLLSMPTGEALSLGSFDRYVGGIFNYLIAFIVVQLMWYLPQIKNYRSIMITLGSLTAVFLCMIVFRVGDYIDIFTQNNYPNSLRQQIENAMPKSTNTLKEKDSSHSYVVYAPASKQDYGYSGYFIKYKVFNRNVTVVDDFKDKDSFDKLLEGKNYLVIVDEDLRIKNYLSDNHFEKVENNTYKLNN